MAKKLTLPGRGLISDILPCLLLISPFKVFCFFLCVFLVKEILFISKIFLSLYTKDMQNTRCWLNTIWLLDVWHLMAIWCLISTIESLQKTHWKKITFVKMKILTESYYTVFHTSTIFQVILGLMMMFYHYLDNDKTSSLDSKLLENCTSMKHGVVIFS